MRISVVIVAKSAERTIGECIRSLLGQVTRPHEIIVVVDSLADSTVEAIEGFPVELVINKGVGLGAARRTGVDVSAGDGVAFIDADCIADEKWTESLVQAFYRNDIMVQAGGTTSLESLTEIAAASQRPADESRECLKFAETQNFAFRKGLIDVVGNFDPWFSEGGEDLDFCIRVGKAGFKIYHNPQARVYHLRQGGSLRRPWRDGRSKAKALMKHGSAMLRDSVIVFAHAISLLALFTLLIVGYPVLALVAFTPSLVHRVYRAAISIGRGNSVFSSLSDSFATYVLHLSFAISFALTILGSHTFHGSRKHSPR